MRSAFLIFDLVGRNASLELKGNARGFIHLEIDDGEEAVGLIVWEKSEPSSGRQSFAKGNGTHPNDFVIEWQLLANTSLRVLTLAVRSGRRAPLSEFKLKSGINRAPYGLAHLFRFELELASAPHWMVTVFCFWLLLARSSLSKSKQKKNMQDC
jgi:hypothetical protein